jgi:DNA end-binding protein Ku
MAKKAKKKSKKDTSGADPVGAVRTAVERTFQATADSAQSTRTRAQDLVDEVASAAGRVREMIEEMRVLEDLKGLRGEVESLARRVAALEGSGSKPAARGRASASRATSSRATGARAKTAASGRKTAAGAKTASAGRKTATGGRKAASTSRSGSTTSRSASTRSAAGRKTAGSTRSASSAAKKPS